VNSLVVCDASAVVALLLDAGPAGRWATSTLSGADLAAPALLRFEAANILRRHEMAGLVSADQAAQAHADLVDLAVEQWPHEVLAPRVWQLRHNLTVYDASYAALAELLDVTLVTLDSRIGRAPGLACTVTTP
jgi:predicted nucleic acid-binding protein